MTHIHCLSESAWLCEVDQQTGWVNLNVGRCAG